MWAVILLGAACVPIVLLAAMIRGGLRARSERLAREREISRFD